ncbi:hypothetical protein Avbf_04905, partial [Armadillidium vulgare]
CPEEILNYGTECLAVAQDFGGVKAYLVEGTADLWKKSTFMNKENCSLQCCSITSTLRAISPCLLHNSFSSDVITDVTLLETEAEYLLSISCLKTISDAENLLNTIKGRLKPRKHNIIMIFSAPKNIPPEGIILPLRQTMEKLYSEDNIVAIVRQRDCKEEPNTQHDSQFDYSENQLTLIIEQCLKSPILESLHSQVLFY